jgi:hypothetical protein
VSKADSRGVKRWIITLRVMSTMWCSTLGYAEKHTKSPVGRHGGNDSLS